MARPWVDWEMLRIRETSAVLGLHPWVFGFPPPHCSPLHPPELSFPSVVSPKFTSPECVRVASFWGAPPVCQRARGCWLHGLGSAGCCSYGDRSGLELGRGTSLLFDPEPSFESTFPLAHAVFFVLNILTMWSINQKMIKYLVLK